MVQLSIRRQLRMNATEDIGENSTDIYEKEVCIVCTCYSLPNDSTSKMLSEINSR